MLGRRALGSLRLRAMRRASFPRPAKTRSAEARRIAGRIRRPTRSHPPCGVSSACRVPLTVGHACGPVLMLPEDAAAWPAGSSPPRRRCGMSWRTSGRGDYALRLCARFWCGAPVLAEPARMGWPAARCAPAQEQACDDLVLNAGTCPTDYGHASSAKPRARCIAPARRGRHWPSPPRSKVASVRFVDTTRATGVPLTIRAAVLGSAFVALGAGRIHRRASFGPRIKHPRAGGPARKLDRGPPSRDQQPRIQIETGLLEYFPTDEEGRRSHQILVQCENRVKNLPRTG